MIAKYGSDIAFTSRTAMLDWYGVGIALPMAGHRGNVALNPLFDTVLALLLPAVEEATREAAVDYTGQFRANGAVSGSIELIIDDGPGLRVRSLNRKGSDVPYSFSNDLGLQFAISGILYQEYRM